MFSRTNRLAKEIYGMTRTEALQKSVCLCCKKPVFVQAADGTRTYNPEMFSTEAGKEEWDISGMCESCWDSLFDGEDQ